MTTLVKNNGHFYPVFPNLFNDFLADDFSFIKPLNKETRTFNPAVNIKEKDDEFLIELAAPGFKKEDFKLSVENNTLTISSEKNEESEEKNNNYTRKEFSYQSFSRSFNLPEKIVNSDEIEAKYSDGILNVRIPKREEQKPKPIKIIDIN